MHTCHPPGESATGKWTCPCGERYWVPLTAGAEPEHICRFPDFPTVGQSWMCPDCESRYYAHQDTSMLSTRVSRPPLKWRRIGA